jgi:outer membrane receptor protein involved in Fe transport
VPFRYDVTRKLTLFDEAAKFKYGVGNAFKFRHYEILFYDMQFFGLQNWSSDDPNQVLNPDNIYPNYPNRIYYQSGNNTPNPNEYASNSNTAHAYVSTEVALNIRTKAVLGLRAEHFIQRHTGRDQTYASGDVTNGKNLTNDVVLNSLDLFPSLNVIYSLNESQNLRLSATRTIARPSFKELSFAQIIDPLTNRIFNGSFFEYAAWSGQLVETRVNNADVRWEKFFERGQMFSISGFFKDFSNPIEMVRIAEQQTSTEFQPRNVGRGTMLGAEIEWNASFAAMSQKLENLFFNGNITLIESQITMSEVEFNSRKSYERVGETIVNTRAMAGQSPYVLNGGVSYTAPESQTNVGVYYNVKGQTLQIVGMGLFPDVYTEPFHSLNFSFSTKVGKEKGIDLKLRASNLLNDDVVSSYVSFGAPDQIFSRYAPGWALSAGLSFQL